MKKAPEPAAWPQPNADDIQVYLEPIWEGAKPEWFVQYGPDRHADRYADGLTERDALAQWHRVHVLGDDS